MKVDLTKNHITARKASYPATGEQLDAIFKMAKALQESGIQLPEETTAWINSCQSVKNKYPKS
jgi:hypothetical protein